MVFKRQSGDWTKLLLSAFKQDTQRVTWETLLCCLSGCGNVKPHKACSRGLLVSFGGAVGSNGNTEKKQQRYSPETAESKEQQLAVTAEQLAGQAVSLARESGEEEVSGRGSFLLEKEEEEAREQPWKEKGSGK